MAVRFYEAVRVMDGSGAVRKGVEIDKPMAVTRRGSGHDLVVCGDELSANREAARMIEAAIGSCVRHNPHPTAGSDALPHFQQSLPPPEGHTFYETGTRKARR